MSAREWVELLFPPDRLAVLWLFLAFVLTLALTRAVTRKIREGEVAELAKAAEASGENAETSGEKAETSGEKEDEPERGVIQNIHIGGLHVHHQVWGILLCMLVGILLITYHPQPGWGLNVLAILFGVGAALALDEFAMWLHLDDVYWSPEGRKSITALMVAGAIMLVLAIGADPLDLGGAGTEGLPGWVVTLVVVLNFLTAIVCLLKGKNLLALIGVFMPLVASFGMVRLAKPGSWWARRFYRPGSRKIRRAEARFDEDYERRWRWLHDAIGGAPHRDLDRDTSQSAP